LAAGAVRRRRVLILGGTAEASRLARRIDAAGDVDLVVSLAGRTSAPLALPGVVRVGGFGGPVGLARYLEAEDIGAVIDATHPFSAQMGRHATLACDETGLPRVRLLRPEWPELPGDRWHHVADLDGAAGALEALGARRVFLTTGRTELRPFARLSTVWFLVRSVEPPDPMPLAQAEVLLDRGPFDEAAERELMLARGVDALVTKNSGGPAGAKLAAARSLGLPVVMVDRPPAPSGPVVITVDDAEAWLASLPAG
jgi:precorrin-6A/cobalt-precorrin-6A reductase